MANSDLRQSATFDTLFEQINDLINYAGAGANRAEAIADDICGRTGNDEISGEADAPREGKVEQLSQMVGWANRHVYRTHQALERLERLSSEVARPASTGSSVGKERW